MPHRVRDEIRKRLLHPVTRELILLLLVRERAIRCDVRAIRGEILNRLRKWRSGRESDARCPRESLAPLRDGPFRSIGTETGLEILHRARSRDVVEVRLCGFRLNRHQRSLEIGGLLRLRLCAEVLEGFLYVAEPLAETKQPAC